MGKRDSNAADGPEESYHNSIANSEAVKSASAQPVFTSDEQISKILSNKSKLSQFREMVIMHIKKNDIKAKIVASDFEKTSNDIMLPLSSFKQCLQVLGINMSL